MKHELKDRFAKQGIVPVIKVENAARCRTIIAALREGGISIAEITYRTEYAPDAIRLVAAEFPDVLVGAGTVTTVEQCREAIAVGAKFIVSPAYLFDVSAVCQEADILYIGGCVTPTEVALAIRDGASIIKFFPAAEFGGLSTIKALSAVFSNVMFMPTGGVNIDNLGAYLKHPRVLACGGSWLVKDELSPEEITRLAVQAMEVNR